MWSDELTTKEAEYTKRAISELQSVEWAKPLLNLVAERGGLKSDNMPILFEVRYAYELYLNGLSAVYEYNAGVNDSTVEFMIKNDFATWLIELVSIRASQATKKAVRQTGLIYEQILSSDAADKAQSEEAEMITAEQKIGEKVFANGESTKFPPANGSINIILTDCRGYLDHGGDIFDYRQMAYGARGIPSDSSWVIHFWDGGKGKEPIKGLFEQSNPLGCAKYIQERIHFLGFISEQEYQKKEIMGKACYLANPHLFRTEAEAKVAFESYPLYHRE